MRGELLLTLLRLAIYNQMGYTENAAESPPEGTELKGDAQMPGIVPKRMICMAKAGRVSFVNTPGLWSTPLSAATRPEPVRQLRLG